MNPLPYREKAVHHHIASRRRVERPYQISRRLLIGLWVYAGLLGLSMAGVLLVGILPALGAGR
ncbi:hypothetical protein [Nonomuraea cavernae]|uniref:Uncharacterized protein n=1 Tax=Nonomuraea cavernae TaxID=2045107 RepID=A0A918DJ40_9ACTN|nr:hypothetical protein [Nonomuraea cavernae]MCA2186295.1 hypothetical protein [Nonomuraea cavernae]GGO69619.1 hypothetical protein GCM10012289_31140 [Nonomuraea cavernae]